MPFRFYMKRPCLDECNLFLLPIQLENYLFDYEDKINSRRTDELDFFSSYLLYKKNSESLLCML